MIFVVIVAVLVAGYAYYKYQAAQGALELVLLHIAKDKIKVYEEDGVKCIELLELD